MNHYAKYVSHYVARIMGHNACIVEVQKYKVIHSSVRRNTTKLSKTARMHRSMSNIWRIIVTIHLIV